MTDREARTDMQTFSWLNVAQLVGIMLIGLALFIGFAWSTANAQELDISQVNVLPADIAAIVNALYAPPARVDAIDSAPGPQGPQLIQGVPGERRPAGAHGAAGAGADPAALAALQVAISTLAQQTEKYIVRDA